MAMMFADIAGSVALYQRMGDAVAKELITSLQSAACEAVSSSEGKVHEIIGDEILACFDQCAHALACAAQLHHCAAQLSISKGEPIELRIGIHIGDVIIDQQRLFGDALNLASRITNIARGGQTLVSGDVIELVGKHWQELARKYDEVTVKGSQLALHLYDIPWQEQGLTRIEFNQAGNSPGILRLVFGGNQLCVTTDELPMQLGRAVTSHLMINADAVSRRHAVLDCQRNRFVISDSSTNGTHIVFDGGESLYLKRESLPLWGSGLIGLGASPSPDAETTIHFTCVENDLTQDS